MKVSRVANPDAFSSYKIFWWWYKGHEIIYYIVTRFPFKANGFFINLNVTTRFDTG